MSLSGYPYNKVYLPTVKPVTKFFTRITLSEKNNETLCPIITDSYSWEDSCSCDHLCLIYGDCCHDFVQICPQEATRGHKLREKYGIKGYPTSTCVPWMEETEFNRILQLDPENDHRNSFFSHSWDTSVINVCFKTGKLCRSAENNLKNYQMLNYQLPVIDTKTGINYINYDCARCNIKNTTTIEPWKYLINCSSLPNDTALSHKLPPNIDEHGCKFILLSPKKTRYCITTKFKCHPDCKNKQLFDACQSFTQRIVTTDKTDSDILFKNEYCAMCHFDPLQLITFEMTCEYIIMMEVVPLSHFSLHIFFKFDPRTGFLHNKGESSERLPNKCSTNEIFIAKENKCRSELRNQQITIEGFNITSYTTYFTVIMFSGKSLPELFNKSLIRHHVKKSISGVNNRIKRQINKFTTNSTNIAFTKISFRSNYTVFHIKVLLCFGHNNSVTQMSKYILTYISEILHRTTSNLINIFKMQTFYIYEPVEVAQDNSNEIEICSWLQYNLSEVHFTPEKIVSVVETGEECQDKNIKFYKQKLYICHNNTTEHVTHNNYTILSISTITCTILSIISILIRLYIQGRVSFLKSYTSKIQCNLCFALLLTYFSLLLAPFFREIYTVCKIMASLIYLGFVSTFTWMVIISFNVLGDFKNSSTLINKSDKSIALTTLLGWGSSLVILIIVLVLDFMPIPSKFRPSLGNTHNQQTLSCWFDQRLALSIYFGIPSTTMILINSVLFFLSLRAVRNAINSSLSFDSHKLGIYIRLSIFMGITWIFALVVCFQENITIQVIFVISNSLQGVFILLSSTCHKSSICSRIVTSRKQTSRNHSSVSQSNNLATLSSDIK